MAKLTDAHRRFIVGRLACFRTPSQVVEEVKELFGIELTRQAVHHYDPDPPASKCPKKWAELHKATREEYLKGEAMVGVAFQRYRLEELDRMLQRAGRNQALRLQILEQAAKEAGGAFTNHRKLEHSGEVATHGVLVVGGSAGDEQDWETAAVEAQRKLAEKAREAASAHGRSGE